jgi:hypothetical protein
MKIRTVLLGAIAPVVMHLSAHAASIDQARLTEVVNSVNIIEPASKKTSAAKVQQVFIAPNVLRTGPDSRAEMISPDQTVTRVGQSTLFSFEPNSREINLQRGSILFQSPSGKGGGNIRTSAASAAVLGTTLIVTTTKNGGFKVLLVEGKGRVKAADGTVRLLKGGQMVYALPGGKLSSAFEFRLSQQVSASRLVGGFKRNLPSVAKIEAAINKQEKEIAQGKAVATNLMASGSPTFAFRVDVARNTLVSEETVPEPVDPLTQAVSTDAVIDAPLLDNSRLFGGGGAVFSSEFGSDNVTPPTRATNPAFFIGNNILFDSPTVDLTSFVMNDLFQFLAINNIDFATSANFGNFPGQEVQLLAGRTFTAAPGTVLSGNGDQIGLIALGSTFPTDGRVPESLDDIALDVPFELTDFGVANTGGGVALIGGDVKLMGVQLAANTNLRVEASRDLAIEGAPAGAVLQAIESPFDNGALIAPTNFSTLNAREQIQVKARRDLRVERTAINSPKTVIDAGTRLKLTAVQINDGSAERQFNPDGPSSPPQASSPSVYLFAKDVADLRTVNFFANDVLIQSQTIRLENVNFRNNSYVILESRIGVLADNPNTGGPVQAGKVNFVRGVNYAGAPAQQRLEQNGPSSGSSSGNPGIYIRPFSGRPKN